MKKIVKFGFMLLFFLVIGISLVCASDTDKIKSQFLKNFPNMQNQGIESVTLTDIKGLYEIVTSNNMIIYFYPEKNYMIFGEIWNTQGKSLTASKRNEILLKRVKNIDTKEAIKIGNGKKKVIEFFDPECPHCKNVYNVLKTNKDKITLYLYPVPFFGPKSEKKVKYMICMENKEKALNDIFEKTSDELKLPESCNIDNEVLNQKRALAFKNGITGVPFLLIDGQLVMGGNIPQIEQLINDTKN